MSRRAVKLVINVDAKTKPAAYYITIEDGVAYIRRATDNLHERATVSWLQDPRGDCRDDIVLRVENVEVTW